MLEAYLRDLEAESGRRLSENEVVALVAEVREHLEESIQARLELGMSPEDAERESIAAFGAAPRVAEDVVQVSAAPRATAKVRLLAAAYALFIVALVAGPPVQRWSETAYHGIFVLGWLTVALFALASFRSRRPNPVRVVSTGLVAAVALWGALGATWLNLYPSGGHGVMPLVEVDRSLVESRRVLAAGLEDQAAFEAGWRILRGPAGIEGLRTAEGHRAPDARSLGYGKRLRFNVLPNPQQAREAWLGVRRNGDPFYTDWNAATIRAIPLARADRMGGFLAFAPESLTVGSVAAAVAGGIDLVFGGLGALVVLLRRKGRGGLRA